MKHLIAILLISSCATKWSKESDAIIHESVTDTPKPATTPVPAPPVACEKDCPPPAMAPMTVEPAPVATPAPTPLSVKKKKKPAKVK